MAESGMKMDDKGFSERVKKTFGSLFASLEPSPSPSPSSLPNPLWSLTGAAVQKKEWRRDTDTSGRDANPCSSSFDDFLYRARKNPRNNLKNYRKELEDDLDGLDDGDDEDEGMREVGGCEDGGIDDWDVRSSIGLDSTLDHEEEEDTFDRVATGRENVGDRLYMKDVIDSYDLDFRSQDDVPGAVGNRRRDPRANLWAAKIRLKEDEDEAGEQGNQSKPPQQAEKPSSTTGASVEKLKPILKRKDHDTTSKPSKRVRFDPGCISSSEIERDASDDMATTKVVTPENRSIADERLSQVPDYVRNPSKYTCYTLDSVDEMNDKSNAGAFMDFLEMVKRSKSGELGSEQNDTPTDLPKSVTFVPKKKSDSSKSDSIHTEMTQDKVSDVKRSSMQSTLLGLAAEEDEEAEVGDMEIDEPEPSDRGTTFKKQDRQYRSKSRTDEEP